MPKIILENIDEKQNLNNTNKTKIIKKKQEKLQNKPHTQNLVTPNQLT